MKVTAPAPVGSLVISAVVTRCGCTASEKAAPHWHALEGEPCPRPQAIEDRGVIVRWHRNPLRQAWNVMRRALGKI